MQKHSPYHTDFEQFWIQSKLNLKFNIVQFQYIKRLQEYDISTTVSSKVFAGHIFNQQNHIGFRTWVHSFRVLQNLWRFLAETPIEFL